MHTVESRKRALAKLHNRRQIWLSKNGPCVKCGSNLRLEVDHINPLEKISHRVWSWREEKRLLELAKCQVLCHICHKDKHRPVLKHGTFGGYDRGCRCLDCKHVNRDRVRRSRALKFARVAELVDASVLRTDCP